MTTPGSVPPALPAPPVFPTTSEGAAAAEPTVHVERWPSEVPLLIMVALSSALIWLALAVTIIGFVYVVLIALVFFFVHLAFITHLRGSAVRLGPRQFPDLYARVITLARRAGLQTMPEVYLLESGGSLNALATRFLRRRMVVLFTDLLEACGDDQAARDMVIGHELGHLRCGHLDWHLFLLPGRLVPFLGSAYSRACEHTCDRWGATLSGSSAGAVRGLAILAAGGKFGPQIDLTAYVEQEKDLDTGWMTLGRWLDPYPPLAARVAALEPQYAQGLVPSVNGPLLASAILFGIFILPLAGVGIGAAIIVPQLQKALGSAALGAPASDSGLGSVTDSSFGDADTPETPTAPIDPAVVAATVESDFDRLEAMIRQWHADRGRLPEPGEFTSAWERFGSGDYPNDPYDGAFYGYYLSSPDEGVLYSSGPDGEGSTADDVVRRVKVAG